MPQPIETNLVAIIEKFATEAGVQTYVVTRDNVQKPVLIDKGDAAILPEMGNLSIIVTDQGQNESSVSILRESQKSTTFTIDNSSALALVKLNNRVTSSAGEEVLGETALVFINFANSERHLDVSGLSVIDPDAVTANFESVSDIATRAGLDESVLGQILFNNIICAACFNENQVEAINRSSQEYPSYLFPDGQKVILITNSENEPLSWLALQSNEYLIRTRFSEAMINSVWFKFRFPGLNPAIGNDQLMVVKQEDGLFSNPQIVDASIFSLSAKSSKYYSEKLGQKIVHEDLENQRNASIKQKAGAFANEEIEANRALLLTNIDGNNIYLVHVNDELIMTVQNDQWIGKPLKAGQFLVVSQNQDGQTTFLSSNFGKAKFSTLYGDWTPDGINKVKPMIERAAEAIYAAKDRPGLMQRMVDHLLRSLHLGLQPEKLIRKNIHGFVARQLARVQQFEAGMATISDGYLLPLYEQGRKSTFDKMFGNIALMTKPELLESFPTEMVETLHLDNIETPDLRILLNDFMFRQNLNRLPESLIADMFNRHLNQTEMQSIIADYFSAQNLKSAVDQIFTVSMLFQQGLIDQDDLIDSSGSYFTMATLTDSLTGKNPDNLTTILSIGAAMVEAQKPEDLEQLRIDVSQEKFNDIINGKAGYRCLIVFPENPGKEYQARLYVPGPPDMEALDLGQIVIRDDIPEINEAGERETHKVFREYAVQYPQTVVQALGMIFAEYNDAFQDLVRNNQEWESDYKYCQTREGKFVNPFVQIDMKGISSQLIEQLAQMPVEAVVNVLKPRIFEIENSLARYNLMRGIFSWDGQESRFQKNMDTALDRFRERFDQPVALLAVTQSKYEHMLATEFGLKPDDPRRHDSTYIKALSGFDYFFGPEDFSAHIQETGRACNYILYARTSLPLDVLQNPSSKIDIPLLQNPATRKVIRENAISFNIDALDGNSATAINDTKAYLISMGLAFPVTSPDGLNSAEFMAFLAARGLVNEKGQPRAGLNIRLKPTNGFYGCYQHIREMIGSATLVKELKKGLKIINSFVAQPELTITRLFNTNSQNSGSFGFIDRIFFYTEGAPETTKFIGGLRNTIPDGEVEIKKGNIHGNKEAVWAEIFA